MDDYGTRSELMRKTLEEVERIVHASSLGMSKREAHARLQTIWQVVSGLVDDELHAILTQAMEHCAPAEGAINLPAAFVNRKTGAGALVLDKGIPDGKRVMLTFEGSKPKLASQDVIRALCESSALQRIM